MKYMVEVETVQIIEVDAATAEAAIELVKQKLNYRPTDTTIIKVVQELTFDEESDSYKLL